MRRLAVALALALLTLAPAAQAFRSPAAEVDIAYALADTPVVLGAGRLDIDATYRDALFAAGLRNASFGPIPTLTIAHASEQGLDNRTVEGATLVVHAGTLLWPLPEGASVDARAHADYGVAFGIPHAPMGEGQSPETAPPGLIAAGPALRANLSWPGGGTPLVLGEAYVTVLDAQGSPVEGWERRSLNHGARTGDMEEGTYVHAEGAFDARLEADALGGGLGRDARATLAVAPASEDRFLESAERFAAFAAQMSGSQGGFPGGANPLAQLSAFSGILNGALLLIATPPPDGGEAPAPLAATLDGGAIATGAFTVLRSGDLRVGYDGSEMRVQGTSAVTITRDGFAVDPPATLWLVPMLSVLLWCAAAGAIALYFVKRPPKAKSVITWRMLAALAHVVVLVVVFLVWDASFAATFGTSALTHARAAGVTGETIPQISSLLALELVPWGLAVLLFALPTRIALGVGLRYLGKGKSFTGLASAGGLVMLGILGPLHALWLMNVLIGFLAGAIGQAFA